MMNQDHSDMLNGVNFHRRKPDSEYTCGINDEWFGMTRARRVSRLSKKMASFRQTCLPRGEMVISSAFARVSAKGNRLKLERARRDD
jgi:hypothetical protein